MRYGLLSIAMLISIVSLSQNERDLIREGNTLYKEGNFKEAAQRFATADSLNPDLVHGAYNRANALYRQEEYEAAAELFNGIGNSTADDAIRAKAFHNLGNAMLEQKDFAQSVEAYKNALRLNPNDEETRTNLAYAMQQLKQQQKNQDEKKKNKDQDQEKKEDEKKNNKQDQKDKNQQDEQKKQDQQNQQQNDKKEQNQDQRQQNNEQRNNQEQDQRRQQQQQRKMSKEDAERILKANQNREKQTQKKLKKRMIKGEPKKVEKNW